MVITYNGDGQVSRVEDKAAGHTTEYEYDGAGRLIRAYRADADGAPLLQAENLYDAYGRDAIDKARLSACAALSNLAD